MSRGAILFPSARRATRGTLRQLLAGRPESYAQGVTVSTKPIPGATGTRPVPFVQVESARHGRDARLAGTTTIRLRVWHDDEGNAEDLALLCEALLLGASSASVRGYRPASGPVIDWDADAELLAATLTLAALPRPQQL